MLWVDEVAVPAPLALSICVLAALGFSEVSDRAVLDVDRVPVVVLASHRPQYALSLFLCGELDVEIADHVLSDVVSHDHVKDLSLLAELEEYFLKELFEVVRRLDQLFLRRLDPLCKGNGRSRVRIYV